MYIRGAQCVNRAVDGDIVAFELLPEVEWFTPCGASDEPAKDEVKTITVMIGWVWPAVPLVMRDFVLSSTRSWANT